MANVKKTSKYKNRKCSYMGLTFDSVGERDRYFYLLDAEKRGEIRNLQRQKEFELHAHGKLICKYKADFVYEERLDLYGEGRYKYQWIKVVEDFKGVMTDVFKIKAKLFEANYGFPITIVKKPTAPIK
jgi:hypothetical protein